MIDYIKISIEDSNCSKILQNRILTFTEPFNRDTGEIVRINQKYCKRTAKTGDFTVDYIKNEVTGKESVYLSGSLHKHNSDGSNHTDFDFRDINETVENLSSSLDINPKKCIVRSIEFGVNIKTPILCSKIIESIVCYKGGKEYELRNFHGTGDLKSFCFDRHRIKIYNKSLYAFSKGFEPSNYDDLMRFEIHVDRMEYLKEKKVEISTFIDLTKKEVLIDLGEILFESFNNLIIADPSINITNAPPDHQLLIINGQSHKYWKEFQRNNNTKQCQRHLIKFRDLVIKYSERELQKTLSEKLKSKWGHLLNVHFSQSLQDSENVHFSPSVQTGNMSTSHTHIICEKETLSLKVCKVTGIDISHQNPRSQFISQKTIENLKKENSPVYFSLLLKFGPKDKSKDVCYYIAHNIRNSNTNLVHNFKKKVINQKSILSKNTNPNLLPHDQYKRSIIEKVLNPSSGPIRSSEILKDRSDRSDKFDTFQMKTF